MKKAIAQFFSTASRKAWVAGALPFIAIAAEPVGQAVASGEWDWKKIGAAAAVGVGTAVTTWAVRNKGTRIG